MLGDLGTGAEGADERRRQQDPEDGGEGVQPSGFLDGFLERGQGHGRFRAGWFDAPETTRIVLVMQHVSCAPAKTSLCRLSG